MDIPTPFRRMTYREAMDRYGSDKPDLLLWAELIDLSDTLRGCGFKVFASALEEGGSVRASTSKAGPRSSRARKSTRLANMSRPIAPRVWRGRGWESRPPLRLPSS